MKNALTFLCIVLLFSCNTNNTTKPQEQAVPEEKAKLTNMAAQESLLKLAKMVQELSGEPEEIAALSSHLKSAQSALQAHNDEQLVSHLQAADEILTNLGLGRKNLMENNIIVPGNLMLLDSIAMQQPLPIFRQAKGEEVASNVFWGLLCLAGYLDCLLHESEETCTEMLELCFGICGAGLSAEEDSDCTSPCEQVRLGASNPLVTIDSITGCQVNPSVGDARAALRREALRKYSYDWKDDVSNKCSKGCSCEATGDGRITSTIRRRYVVVSSVGQCKVHGTVSLELKKRRRDGECFRKK